MTLPEPCERCAPFGGDWMETKAGLRRCVCPRGIAKSEIYKPKKPRPPAISTETSNVCVEVMGALEFFPAASGARAVIADEIASMCESEDRAVWLAKRMVRLYSKWPGLPELRRVYCSANHPLDAIQPIGFSEAYPDGIPSERIEDPKPLQLSGTVTASPSIAATVSDLAEKTNLSNALSSVRPSRVREIPVQRVLPLTEERRRELQSEIDRVELEMRNRKAREEIGLAAK